MTDRVNERDRKAAITRKFWMQIRKRVSILFSVYRCHLLCHPVNCDPCNVMLQMQCHCGREQKSLLCGSFYTTSGTAQKLDIDRFLRCEQICGRMSSCGLHACERQCHTGDCEDCGLLREKTCYCGKHSKNSPCGGAVQAKARQLCHSSGKKVSWQGEYSCGQPCPWKYDCGTHSEAMTNAMICHPHSSSDPIECPRSPSLVSSCPCGQTTLSEISSIPRTSCSDSIPSCGKVCSKITPQCGHVCDQVCHEGPCGQCEEIMKLVCRCGNEKRSIKCAYLQAQGEAELLCEKHCKALRNCGRHECGRKVSFRVFAISYGILFNIHVCFVVLSTGIPGSQSEAASTRFEWP